MAYRFPTTSSVVLNLALSSYALAQVPPQAPAAQAPTSPTTAQGTPAVPAPGSAAAGAIVSDPSSASTELADPMLEPPPAATHTLATWREALNLIRTRATSIAISRARIAESRAGARGAWSGALPSLTGTGSVTHHLLTGEGQQFGQGEPQELPDPRTLFNAQLTLRQPILALRPWHDIGTANRRTTAAQFRAQDTERQALAAVAQAIVDVVTAERLAEVSRVALRSSLETFSLTERRAKLGAGSKLDVLRTEEEVSLSRSQVVSANEALARARETLGMTLGYSAGWGVTSDVNLNSLSSDARGLCSPVRSVDERSDVRAATVQAEVAERGQTSASYDLAPVLDLFSDLNYSNQDFTPNGKPVQWTIGALLTVPLYDGGSRYASRERAVAETDIARQELTQTKRQAELETTQARRAVSVAAANLAVSTKTRAIAKETARLAQVAFVNGSGTTFDLVDTARRLRVAELDLAIKEFEVVRAQLAALLATANCNL